MSQKSINTVLVTGANSGLGYESVKQLVQIHNVKKVYLACRSETKAQEAIKKLVTETGQPESTFQFIAFDSSDVKSCTAAVSAIDTPLDGVILNAGGMMGFTGAKTIEGANDMFAANVLGHAAFIEKAIAEGKLSPQARIVFSGTHVVQLQHIKKVLTLVIRVGSEGSREMTAMKFKTPTYEEHTADCLYNYVSGATSKSANEDAWYGYVKNLGTLYISALARRHTEYHFLTISPGGTVGTAIASNAGFFKRIFFSKIAFPAMHMLGKAHTVDVGAARYLTGIIGTELPASGTFIATTGNAEMTGPVGDQSVLFPMFADETLQDAVYDAIHRII